MTLSVADIATLAPDQAALDAARKLMLPKLWSLKATDQAGLAWGECQGSGSAPYRISLHPEERGYKCNCPSRKFPCKHVLALLWQWAVAPGDFTPAPVPDWVADWAARRKPARKSPPASGDSPDRQLTLQPAVAPPENSEPDEKAASRAAAQRERLRLSREAGILAGLDELDRWIADRLTQGLTGFAAIAHEQCCLVARRMADAKAPGLALILDELPVSLLTLPDAARPGWLIEQLGRLYLMSSAYRRQDQLPAALRAELRRQIGWTVERAALLEDETAPRVNAVWHVIGATSLAQPDGLLRAETWLARLDNVAEGEPRFALLQDFNPASAGAGPRFTPGEGFAAELVFYPSAVPLRAIIASGGDAALIGDSDIGGCRFPTDPDPGAALTRYEAVLTALPWVSRWPLGMGGVRLRDSMAGLMLSDASGTLALPVPRAQEEGLLPLLDREIAVAGLWDGLSFHVLVADTPIGTWYHETRS